MRLKFILLFLLCVNLQSQMVAQSDKQLIFQSGAYSVFGKHVEQGKFIATALSSTQLSSNYRSLENDKYSSRIEFKFSINCRDNEMVSGKNHIAIVDPVNGFYLSNLIKFGIQNVDTLGKKEVQNLAPNTKIVLRLDMRHIMKAFKEQGFYTFENGEKLYQADFKGVYVAGASRPMFWDFNNLKNVRELQLVDPGNTGIYKTEIILNAKKDERKTDAQWEKSKNTSAFPQYHSDYPLSDAVYNLALEEMINAVEPDSTFRTGKEWAGVWTRDISYSILLSMAHLQPKVAQNSLMRKVKNKRIIQDTGTGGAYPISTDRMVWALAAWEVYKASGDLKWLKSAYEIIKNSIDDDRLNAFDVETGLMRGESSFLDWREQTYPRWMLGIDIYQSENLGTNAVHYQANKILAEMARSLNESAAVNLYITYAENLKASINKYFWNEKAGYYGQFLYGKNHLSLSPRSEALGEALCVLFGIAEGDKLSKVISNTPVCQFGIPCIYPQIPGIPAYHNNAIWPFVQSYWALASAKVGNEKSVLASIAAIYRPAALYLTNKENFVVDNGDYAGTQINSSNMLWSLSGSLSLVQKVIFGIEFKTDSLIFHPFVPKSLQGKRSLSNFKYRNTILNIEMNGYGNQIEQFFIDGVQQLDFSVSYDLKGTHQIKIVLKNKDLSPSTIHLLDNYTSLTEPILKFENKKISWLKIDGAKSYKILKNGLLLKETKDNYVTISDETYTEYQVIAVDAKQVESFASEPILVNGFEKAIVIEAETLAKMSDLKYKDYKSDGYIELSTKLNTSLQFKVFPNKAGRYTLYFRYANGNGPINTDNKCAIRSVYVDQKYTAAAVFPQKGKDEWSNWGLSNPIQVNLEKGENKIDLKFQESNNNMNVDVNQLMLDQILIFPSN